MFFKQSLALVDTLLPMEEKRKSMPHIKKLWHCLKKKKFREWTYCKGYHVQQKVASLGAHVRQPCLVLQKTFSISYGGVQFILSSPDYYFFIMSLLLNDHCYTLIQLSIYISNQGEKKKYFLPWCRPLADVTLVQRFLKTEERSQWNHGSWTVICHSACYLCLNHGGNAKSRVPFEEHIGSW